MMHRKFRKNNKELQIKTAIKNKLSEGELTDFKKLVSRFVRELEVDSIDCAAALLALGYPELVTTEKKTEQYPEKIAINTLKLLDNRYVRYRLNIGRKHQVSGEELKSILVDVAGVEQRRIRKLDIRNYFTLVDLPDGMPADIFQLISETEVNQQKLNIKRVKYHKKFHKKKTAQSQQTQAVEKL